MLRKIFLTLPLAALFFIGLNAQTEKGTFSIGLNTGPGLRYSAHAGYKGLLLNGDLRAGYFIKNNLMIGGEYGLSYFKLTQNGEEYANSKGFHSGLFVRKYFDLKNPKWKPYIEVGAGFNHGELIYQYPNSTLINLTKNTGYARAELGLAFFINKNGCGSNLMYFYSPFLSKCFQNCSHRPVVQISPLSKSICSTGSKFHRIPEPFSLCLTTTLQAASVTPEPIG